MFFQRTIAAIAALFLMSACASYKPAPAAPSSLPSQYSVSGRVAVNAAGKGYNARFNWAHQDQQDRVDISNPLGQVVARLEMAPEGARFFDTDGQLHVADDIESLSERELGWRLPAAGLRYWLLGLADPTHAASWQEEGGARILLQDGWRIQYPVVTNAGAPDKLSLKRNDLEVRIALYDWQLAPQ
ncbi:lipoprotein insertase outer membrane protein LolB [Chitinimonas sp. BJB300]|uniref:lipoprotein insertase outer membrane protein LolB n=1 Tax=Chitinimonas sp. BJB300 TaxID=1559339 RepID=UPI0013041E68|nr:lipoprotein insertase outer membrane protein LolB [Chitinimonas sp. BJB300]